MIVPFIKIYFQLYHESPIKQNHKNLLDTPTSLCQTPLILKENIIGEIEMFDANARYLPDGKLFFAECRSLNPESFILNRLLKTGKVYLCEKLGDNPDTCKFRIFLNSTKKDYLTVGVDFNKGENLDYYTLFVYSGCPDGSGFICNKLRSEALDFLGGEWYK